MELERAQALQRAPGPVAVPEPVLAAQQEQQKAEAPLPPELPPLQAPRIPGPVPPQASFPPKTTS